MSHIVRFNTGEYGYWEIAVLKVLFRMGSLPIFYELATISILADSFNWYAKIITETDNYLFRMIRYIEHFSAWEYIDVFLELRSQCVTKHETMLFVNLVFFFFLLCIFPSEVGCQQAISFM